MTRVLAFVIALLLLAGTVEPSRGWMIALTALAGLGALRFRWWMPLAPRVRLDMRLVSFAVAVLLLAAVVEPTRDWLIVLSVVTGLAAFMPHVLSLEQSRGRDWRRHGWERWDVWEGDTWR